MTKKSKLINFVKESTQKKIGDNPRDVVEKSIVHSEDNLYCKYYEKKGDKDTKIIVKPSSDGKEYILIVKNDNTGTKTSVHDKKEIIAFLKKNDNLAFMLEYIEKAGMLALTDKIVQHRNL